MKKIVIATFALVSTFQANAFTTNLKQSGLKPTDEVSCVVNFSGVENKNKNDKGSVFVTSFAAKDFDSSMSMFKSMPKVKLLGFTLKVNGKVLPGCNNLLKKNGNTPMRVTAILTPKGCK